MRRRDSRTIQPRSRFTDSSVCEPSSVRAARGVRESWRSKATTVSMKVGINCLQVDPFYVGGVTTYVLGLLEGFANAGNGCRFRLFVTEANQQVFEKFLQCDNFDVIVMHNKLFSFRSNVCRAALLSHSSSFFKFVSDAAFRDVQELMDSESDILYTPTPVLRYFNGRRPTVLTMHDIQHVHHPEFFSWSRLLSRRITYGLSARHAGYFQANCNYIKEDLLAHFPWLAPEQVEVIQPGVPKESLAPNGTPDSLSDRYHIPERFLYFPAQLWPHKNHLTILKALKQIESKDGLKIPLVLTGAEYSGAPRIFDFIADQSMNYVHYLGKIPYEDVLALYRRAAFMITATLHESNCFPILEAAAAGTPVIASRIPPFEEFGEVLQLNLFNPLDTQELARLIVPLWKDGKSGSAQAVHNREHVSFYSWENAARKYVKLFERALNS
jgi:glycosyltransferase involved in cell wall biosynthesis